MTQPKWITYAVLIHDAIANLIVEGEIDKEDFEDDENTTDFVYAMSIAAPKMMYEKLTGDTSDALAFNHIANRLCMQYMNKMNKEEE